MRVSAYAISITRRHYYNFKYSIHSRIFGYLDNHLSPNTYMYIYKCDDHRCVGFDCKKQFAIIEFEKPVYCAEKSLVIGSKLDTDAYILHLCTLQYTHLQVYKFSLTIFYLLTCVD